MNNTSRTSVHLAAFLPVALIVFLGAVLRLYQLDLRSLWLDEATSLDVATHSAAEILGGRAFNNHTPPFYYILLHYWLQIFPTTEWGMRLLSAVLDILNVSLVFCIVSRQFSRRAGITAALFYATSPFAIYFAQEARMYSLVIFLGLVTYGLALRFLESPSKGAWQLGLIAAAVAGLYTHYFYAFFLASLCAALLFECRRDLKKYAAWLLPLVVAGICFLPWVKVVAGLAAGPGQTFRQFVLTVPPYAFFRFAAGYALMPLTFGLKDDMRQTVMMWLPVILPFFVVFAALVLAGLKRAISSAHPGLFLSALFGPAVISFALAAKMNILSERYWGVSFPFFVAAFAILPWGNTRLRLWLAAQLVAAALWAAASLSHFTNPAFGFADWRAAARIASAQPNSLVVVRPGFNGDVFRYYYGSERPVLDVPETELIQTTLAKLWTHAPGEGAIIVLVESGELPSIQQQLINSGFSRQDAKLLPFENGIHVSVLRRDQG